MEGFEPFPQELRAMLKSEEISSLLSISSKTLERRYRKEIDEGRAQARLSVEAVIYRRITSADKSIATANLQKWWMDRNFPVENSDHGQPIRALVRVDLPDNGRGHPSFLLQNRPRIIDKAITPPKSEGN
jgi:hypothetical protein